MSYESTIMEHKGYKAQVMEAPRLVGDSNFGLPPGQPIDAYPVDVFIKIPENWMKGPGIFVVPVKKNKGLWFNFRQNSEINTAVIMTVKGCNPITGLQTSGFHLEKYEKSCPKHGCDFLAERFCPECNYKWPDRNFLSGDPLWWDVWKTSDGIGRQFYFTEDELKDIATHKIGSENTVPAFGFAFYSPKERRPEKEPARVFGASLIYGNKDYKTWEQLYTYNGFYTSSGSDSGACYLDGLALNNVSTQDTKAFYCSSSNVSFKEPDIKASQNRGLSKSLNLGTISCKSFIPQNNMNEPVKKSNQIKEVSIAAGAKIAQDLPSDSYSIDTWRDAPDAVMTVYFVFQEKFEELKAGGIRDFKGVKEGMLEGLPVG